MMINEVCHDSGEINGENSIEGELSLKVYLPGTQIKIPAWTIIAK
jgi:hypothetical protein